MVGSFAMLFMWVKMFYWLRLFKEYSAFIRMITASISDASIFLVVFLLSLIALANIMFILNINRQTDYDCQIEGDAGEDGEPVFSECDYIYETPFSSLIADSFVHAYLTSLGDFRTDSYE